MAEATFNPNELIIEKVRSVEAYDPDTKDLLGRYTQIEDPSLQLTANGTDVTDAMGAPITTFYNAQSGTFGFSNSIFSLDLAASQFGTEKVLASTGSEIIVPVSETIDIVENKVVLKYTPVGAEGAEVKFVRVINSDNTFGKKYVVDPTSATDDKFTIDADTKTITLPTGTTGRVFVNYERKSETAAMITKSSDSVPSIQSLLAHVIFHDKCNPNKVYAGIVSMPRAQIDPSSIDIALTSDGKHAVSYLLRSNFCDENAKLVDIIVAQD